jgi:hypothetical protein
MDLADVIVGATAIVYIYKHYTLKQVVAAVKAEVAKIEGEITTGSLAAVEAKVVAEVTAIVVRIKALL